MVICLHIDVLMGYGSSNLPLSVLDLIQILTYLIITYDNIANYHYGYVMMLYNFDRTAAVGQYTKRGKKYAE